MTDALLTARALVVHDLAARGLDSARTVSIVDEVLTQRRWWVVGRWPLCALPHEEDEVPHELRVAPDLGDDPHWVCEEQGCVVAPVGALPQ